MKLSVIKYLSIFLFGIMALVMGGCGSSDSGDAAPTLEKLEIKPADSSVPVGVNIKFYANAVYSDGSEKDVTVSAKWNSSNPAVAEINGTGAAASIARTLQPGTVTVTAVYEDINATTTLNVLEAELTAISLTFANGGTQATVPNGYSGDLIATASYTDGTSADITDKVAYDFNNSVVDINGTGHIKTVSVGSTEVFATLDGINSNQVDVNVTAAILKALQIQPNNNTMKIDETKQLIALGTFSDGSIRNIASDVSWNSSDTSIVTVDSNGRITAISAGDANIIATSETNNSISNTASVTVSPALLTALKIVKADNTQFATDDEFIVGETRQLKAVGDFDDGTTNVDITEYVVWTAGANGTVSVDQHGLVKALKAGDASVTAAYNGPLGNESDTVSGKVVEKTVDKIIIFSDPDPAEAAAGHTIKLEAWAKYNDGDTQNVSDTVKWIVDNKNITVTADKYEKFVTATSLVTTTGTVTALHNSGAEGTKAVAFTEKVADHIEIQEGYCGDGNCPVITGKTIDIPIVDKVEYDPVSEGAYYPTAWLVYSDSSKEYINTDRGINWWSADQVRAYVNTIKGSFIFGRGLGNGIEISVSYRGEHKTSFFVNVYEDNTTKTLQEIGIVNTKDLGWGCSQDDAHYGQKLILEVGDDGKHLMACGKFKYTDGSMKWEDINNNVIWSSTDPDVARVRTNTGELKALAEGTTDITAQLAEIKGSIHVRVEKAE